MKSDTEKSPPFDILKAVFILFIGVGLGLLYTFYRIGGVPWIAWVGVSLILILLFVLYDAFFLNILPVFDINEEKQQNKKNGIVYSEKGFMVKIPVLNLSNYIEWDSIEAIVFHDQCHGEAYNFKYLFYLKTPYIPSLDKNAIWINRVVFSSKSKHKTLWIDDNANKDFFTLRDKIKQYLLNSQAINSNIERSKILVKKEIVTVGDRTVSIESSKPKSGVAPVQLVYDSKNQSLEEVYKRYGHF